jgi:hypothetical protein
MVRPLTVICVTVTSLFPIRALMTSGAIWSSMASASRARSAASREPTASLRAMFARYDSGARSEKPKHERMTDVLAKS